MIRPCCVRPRTAASNPAKPGKSARKAQRNTSAGNANGARPFSANRKLSVIQLKPTRKLPNPNAQAIMNLRRLKPFPDKSNASTANPKNAAGRKKTGAKASAEPAPRSPAMSAFQAAPKRPRESGKVPLFTEAGQITSVKQILG